MDKIVFLCHISYTSYFDAFGTHIKIPTPYTVQVSL